MMDLIVFLFGLFILTIAAAGILAICFAARKLRPKPKKLTKVYFLYMSPANVAKGMGDGN
jgi:hypothetical protein